MKHPKFASELRIGDRINGHCDGWLVVRHIVKHEYTSFQNIEVILSNGSVKKYSESESVDAVRI